LVGVSNQQHGCRLRSQTDAGKAELAQEMRRTKAAAVQAKILMRDASPEKRRRASAQDVFDSFDLDGSGTIDVRTSSFDMRRPPARRKHEVEGNVPDFESRVDGAAREDAVPSVMLSQTTETIQAHLMSGKNPDFTPKA